MDVRPGYKQVEVGVVPEDWEVKPLGEMGTFKNGINKAIEDFGYGSPFVNLMDVFGIPKAPATTEGFGLINATEAERSAYALRAGDVLFVRSSVKPEGVGLTTLVASDLPETVFSGFLIRFRSSGLLATEFKEHCFHGTGFRQRLIASSTVSANTNINQRALSALSIAFPRATEEQRAIATALSDVDALITKLDQLIAKKRDLKQAAMHLLLTGKARLPGFSEEWEVQRLGEIGEFLKGRGVTRDQSQTGLLPCVRYGELYTTHHNVIHSYASWISPKVAATALRLCRGDILFAGSGETKEEIGKSAAFITEVAAYAGGDIVVLRQRSSDPVFLGYALNTSDVNQQKASYGQGDAVVHISANALAKIRLAIPDLAEQTAIANVLSAMDAEIAALEARRDKTRAMKQGMVQVLLTGQVRLPVGTESMEALA